MESYDELLSRVITEESLHWYAYFVWEQYIDLITARDRGVTAYGGHSPFFV